MKLWMSKRECRNEVKRQSNVRGRIFGIVVLQYCFAAGVCVWIGALVAVTRFPGIMTTFLWKSGQRYS